MLFSILIMPTCFASNFINSKDDLYLEDYYDGLKIPYKARFVLSDYGGLEKPYHAYYADPDTGYKRYYDYNYDLNPVNVRSTREYSLHSTHPEGVSEEIGTYTSNNAGTRGTFYYPGDKYSNSYFLGLIQVMDFEKDEKPVATHQNQRPTYKAVFRNEKPEITVYEKDGSIKLKEIPDINEYIRSKRPKKIYNKPDNFYYNPRERTTLERPYIYYKLEKKSVRYDEEVDLDD